MSDEQETQQNTPIFDDDPAESAEPDTLAAAIERAKVAGFVIEKHEIFPGADGYQLKSPEGEYIQFGGTEESVWKHAHDRDLLPHRI